MLYDESARVDEVFAEAKEVSFCSSFIVCLCNWVAGLRSLDSECSD